MRLPGSWSAIDDGTLLVAYRKAKAEAAIERPSQGRDRFAQYERDLRKNIVALRNALARGKKSALMFLGTKVADPESTTLLIPKSIRLKRHNEHEDVVTTSAAADWSFFDHSKAEVHYRVTSMFGADIHIFSVLWCLLVGEKLNERVGTSVYSHRLRMLGSSQNRQPHFFHPFLFQPYYEGYREWRTAGIRAAREELSQGRETLVATFDLQAFYHNIDPSFVLDADFLSSVGVSFGRFERELTEVLVGLLRTWATTSDRAVGLARSSTRHATGIPVGLAASRILSNVLLHDLDRRIRVGLRPIAYGRYVDDMFLVLPFKRELCTAEAVLVAVQAALGRNVVRKAGRSWEVTLGKWQRRSKFILNPKKTRVIILEPQGGRDVLDSLDREFLRLSSERRLPPEPEEFDESASVDVLTLATTPGAVATVLKDAEDISLRRFGLSVLLGKCNKLAQFLESSAWRDERARLYRLLKSHVLTPRRIIEHFDSIATVLGIAVANKEWNEFLVMVSIAEKSIDQIASDCACRLNAHGRVRRGAQHRKLVHLAFDAMVSRALCENWPFERQGQRAAPVSDRDLAALLPADHWLRPRLGGEHAGVMLEAEELLESDLHRVPLKDGRRIWGLSRRAPAADGAWCVETLCSIDAEWNDRVTRLVEFLRATGDTRVHGGGGIPEEESLLPFLFPVKPLSPDEILSAAQIVEHRPPTDWVPPWIELVNAVRGVALTVPQPRDVPSDEVWVPAPWRRKPRVVLTNIRVDDDQWTGAATGQADTGLNRYRALVRVAKQAMERPRPDYVVFPELSIPQAWFRPLGRMLANEGISMVAGVEYEYRSGQVRNQAGLSLVTNALPYRTSVFIKQDKARPAPHEAELLSKLKPPATFCANWPKPGADRPRVNHGGLFFGVLICSELTNIAFREAFRGAVDWMIVPSWNQDLRTFEALVSSSALDVHSFIAVVNNRQFGDSWVRAPYAEEHRRDLCKVRGGLNDYVVAVEIPVASLRAFQAGRAPGAEKPEFKPLPDGFVLDARRGRRWWHARG